LKVSGSQRPILSLLLFLASCATQSTISASNYKTELIYPDEVYPFVFVSKKIYDDPRAGVSLSYQDTKNPTDFITVYVYPIASVDWSDSQDVMSKEMDNVLLEVDHMVKLGHYLSRGEEIRSIIEVSNGDVVLTGLRSKFSFINKEEANYDSFAYLFLSEDKYIKFRTSFDSSETQGWNGDAIVKKLLPGITVPKESEYMADIRQKHRERMAAELLNSILKNATKIEPQEDQE